MKTLNFKYCAYPRWHFLLLFFAFNSWMPAANGQNLEAKYCLCKRNSSKISGNSPDTTYMHIDTAFQFEFKKNGTFIRTDKKFTEIYTPSKRKVRYLGKRIRVIKGSYKLEGNKIYILSGFASAGGTLNKVYELEKIVEWSHIRFVLWDVNGNIRNNYTRHEYFYDCTNFYSKAQRLTPGLKYTVETQKVDTFWFWATQDYWYNISEPLQSKFLYPGVHFYSYTYIWYQAHKNFKMHDSTYAFEDKHTYDSGYLKRYFYEGSKKDSLNASFYEFDYDASKYYGLLLLKIFDSKDASYFLIRRDLKNNIIGFDHFNYRNELIETYR